MPTASIKAEKVKQPCLEANEPLRQGITIVEHKIRNLEKRKTKLDGYKDLEAAGKELNSDQLNAIKKYDEVLQTLEFARDLCKQLNSLASETAKAYKKQLRKEAAEKAQQEISRTKEFLIIQDVLTNMGQDQVREDLIEGRAKIQLTQEELTQIDSLYLELSPKQDASLPYMNQFQNPAEHLASLMEGKSKEAFGTTYAALKSKLLEIASSGYFDPPQVATTIPPTIEPAAAVVEPQPAPPQEVPPAPEEVVEVANETVTPPSAPAVVETTTMPVMQEVSQLESQLIQQQQAAAHLSAFKAGPIDFIQENEVDEGENESSIPTLTYTNQNYTPNKMPANAPPAPPEQQQQLVTPVVDNINEWAEETNNQPQHQPPQPVENEEDTWKEVSMSGNWESANHWQTQQTHHHHHHQQNSDGFIQAGGGRGSRGGRGRGGGRGGPNRSQQPRPNNRGGYREGGGGGGYNKDGQSYYQNGFRGGGGGDRRGGGGGRNNYSGERGGRGGGRGSRGANTGGGYRGGSGGGYRQQHHPQQQQQ